MKNILRLKLRDYRRGTLSLGRLARELDMTLGDAIDFLADVGVKSPIEYDDYLRGYAALEGAAGKGGGKR